MAFAACADDGHRAWVDAVARGVKAAVRARSAALVSAARLGLLALSEAVMGRRALLKQCIEFLRRKGLCSAVGPCGS